MGLNVEMTARKARPFPTESLPRIEAVAAAHARLPRPPEAGRVIGLKRKSAG
jgi:hypothetical protein